jgi:6-phosphogluconolactonase (cycloisomerase 2 family)/chitodextrinase
MSFSSRVAVLVLPLLALATHAVHSAEVTDNFDRANGSLGASWSLNADGDGTLQIVSNRVQPGRGSYGESLYTASSFGGAQFSEVQLVSGLAGGGVINLVVRARQYSGGGLSDSYRGQINGLTNSWRIIRLDNNAETVLASGSVSIADGDTYTFSAEGSLLTLKRNNVNLGTATDGIYTTGVPGLGLYNHVSLLVDNWRGGDYASGDVTPPGAPGSVTATPASTTQINLSWSAATDNVGVTGYRVERCQGAGCSGFAQVATPTVTSFNDAGLIAATTYQYRVRAVDAAGNLGAYSVVAAATTLSPSGITDNFNRADGALGSSWTQNVISPTSLQIVGNQARTPVDNYSESIYTASSFGANHFTEVQYVSGLSRGVINLPVRAQQFTSAGQGDGYIGQLNGFLGQWRILRVDNNVEATLASGSLSYAANDVFNFEANGTTLTLRKNGVSLGSATDGTYAAGAPGLGLYDSATLLVDNWRGGSAGADTAAPTAPSGVTASAISASQINVGWTASTDNVGVTTYKVERCQGAGCTTFAQIATPTGITFSDTGLASGTPYRYQVRASDAAGNNSGYSSIATATTQTAVSTYTIGGTMTGLAGSGLVLQNNGGNNQAVGANGAFTFSTPLAAGAAYAVTVLTQPSAPTQSCVVTNGSGTVGTANITNVAISCTTVTRTIGGTVTGLAGSGLVLQNNGGNNLAVGTNGAFTFTTPLASGTAYAVTVLSQPSTPAQNCVVTNGSGTVGATNIANVTVTCTTTGTRTIGGSVSGLAGTGLLLRNNGGDTLSVSVSGAFTFATPLTTGASYAVTVFQQPSSPAQTCAVANGTGTVASTNVTNVAVTCTTNGTKFAFYSNEGGTQRVGSYLIGANGGFTQASALPVSAHSLISSSTIRATGVAVTPSGGHVIVAVDGDDWSGAPPDGELQVYSVNGSGQLAWVSTSRMGSPNYSNSYCGNLNSGGISCGIGVNSAPETVVIHPNGRFVYVMDGVAHGACNTNANPCSDPKSGNRVIVRYSFDPASGTLTYQDRHYVEGFMSLAIDPQGRFLWATSYLEKKIYEFRIDQSTGALTFGTGTFIGQSNGDMWLGINPNGLSAYAAHEGDGTIDAYTIDQSTGHLTNIPAVANVNDGNYNKVTGIYVWSLAVSANGRALYAGSDRVIAYALGTDGRIGAQLAGSPYYPATPLDGGGYRALLGTGPSGQFLYLQGYDDSKARVFSINPTTGVLTETAASPTPLASGTTGNTAISVQ